MPNCKTAFDSYIEAAQLPGLTWGSILEHEIVTAVLACLDNKFTGSRPKFIICSKCKEIVIFLTRSQFKTQGISLSKQGGAKVVLQFIWKIIQ